MPEPPLTIEAGRCMKCGFCMSTCPVYNVDHIESHVARGRNMLIAWMGDNEIATNGSYRKALYYCLLCGRCEAVCPARIPSPSITMKARGALVREKGLSWLQRFVYRGVLKHRPLTARALGWVSRLPGISKEDGGPLRHLADSASVLSGNVHVPSLSVPFLSKRLPNRIYPPDGTRTRGQEVAFFPGCAFEFFFADAGEDTAMALANAGFEVAYPEGLGCCGLAVNNAGDMETARAMAMHNIDLLSGFDHIVTGCATCGSALKDYGQWFDEDDPYYARAQIFSGRVHDLSEFLVASGFEAADMNCSPSRITYHDPCHLKWHQGVSDAPRNILHSMKGVEFVEMVGADMCCGLGGMFGITHRDVSLSIQAKKMEAIGKTGADMVVTSCPGCMIQLMDGIRRHNLKVEVVHISRLIHGQTRRPHRRR